MIFTENVVKFGFHDFNGVLHDWEDVENLEFYKPKNIGQASKFGSFPSIL